MYISLSMSGSVAGRIATMQKNFIGIKKKIQS